MDEIVQVSSDDKAMTEAIFAARNSLQTFLDAFLQPNPTQTNFLLKVRFEEGDDNEHIWLADLDLVSDPPTGVVANEPHFQTLSFMQRTPFDPGEVTDWMFMEDGVLVGGFTTKVLDSTSRPN